MLFRVNLHLPQNDCLFLLCTYIDILIFYNDFNIPATKKYNSLVMNIIKNKSDIHINDISKLKEK